MSADLVDAQIAHFRSEAEKFKAEVEHLQRSRSWTNALHVGSDALGKLLGGLGAIFALVLAYSAGSRQVDQLKVEQGKLENEKAAATLALERSAFGRERAEAEVQTAKNLRLQAETQAAQLQAEQKRLVEANERLKAQQLQISKEVEDAARQLSALKPAPGAEKESLGKISAALADAADVAGQPIAPVPSSSPDLLKAQGFVKALFSPAAADRLNAYQQLTTTKLRTLDGLPASLIAQGRNQLDALRQLLATQPPPANRGDRERLLRRGLENIVVTLRDISRTVTFPQKAAILSLVADLETLGGGVTEEGASLRRWLNTAPAAP